MDGFDMLDLRHERSWAKWRKDLQRNDPPPFLGPLVSISEAMEALNRSETYVRHRIEDGRLNVWKDPISKRVWILKDDLDILVGDNRALEEAGKIRGGKRGPRTNPNPQSEIRNPQSEDLDAIGGWEHPKPPPIIGGAAIEESAHESQQRYEQKQRENEEWYAAELAKLEDRDPEEAVRQLQLERGWITPEPITEPAPESVLSLESLYPRSASPRKQRKEPARPVSWSDPNPRQRTPPEPYLDPDDQSAMRNPKSEIDRPFPIGWVGYEEAAAMLQVCPTMVHRLVRKHNLQRRQSPIDRRRYLYDSVEIERLGERRLDAQKIGDPGWRLDWWGSRSVKMELSEFDSWITTVEAAAILGVTRGMITVFCNRGLLPCYQEKPGVRGSRLFVSHHHTLHLRRRKDEAAAQRAKSEPKSVRIDGVTWMPRVEQWDIDECPARGWSKTCERNHGDYYSTRQAANVLGVNPRTVRGLLRRGRLTGHRLTKIPNARRPWWFFKREDVDALLADPQYNRNHKRWLATVRRKAGWED